MAREIDTRAANQPDLPSLLTVPEAAAALRLSTRTVRRMLKSGSLASVTIGRSVRIRSTDLASLISRP
jgi:excisionase family DNA binding protein